MVKTEELEKGFKDCLLCLRREELQLSGSVEQYMLNYSLLTQCLQVKLCMLDHM